ncbi:MAG: phosphatidylglycerol lysyltransferase domain-containing protein [Chlamydiae bacterium]|nr:phosphatidylglycerol lysyltransferase domain-containing protein [Chlamydiota bacterium]
MEILHKTISTQIAEYVRCWGGPASITFLDSAYQFFSDPAIDGVIGYREEYSCAVVMGDPLTTQENKIPLAKAFKEFCKQKNLPIIYVTVSESFAIKAFSVISGSLIEVVDELILDPQNDPKIGSKGRLLRGKVSQGIRFGLTAHEYTSYNERVEEELEEVGRSWLKAREGPQIYLAPVNLFSSRIGKRYIYAKYQDKIIGVILLHQIEASHGWLLQLLLATPDAPNGTSEFLVSSVIDILKEEGCHYLSFGSAQKPEIGLIKGLNKASVFLARLGYKAAKKIFPLYGRRKYWEKFSPSKAPSYVLFENSRISFKEIGAIMKALNVKI